MVEWVFSSIVLTLVDMEGYRGAALRHKLLSSQWMTELYLIEVIQSHTLCMYIHVHDIMNMERVQ